MAVYKYRNHVEHEEAWRGVKDFPGYWISSRGIVRYRQSQADEWEVIEPYKGKDGDPWIRFNYYYQEFDGPLYFLMLRNFFEGNSLFVSFAYHDGDHWNLDLDNIYPVTRDENGIGTPIRFRVGANGTRRLDRRMKRRVRIVETGEIFNNVSELATHIEGQSNGVYLVLRGKLGSHKGLTFEWVDE